MSDERDFQRAAADWLAQGSDVTPPQAIDAVVLAVRTTRQERDLRIPWRTSSMPTLLRVAAVIAVIAVAGFAAVNFLGAGSDVGSVPPPSPSVEPSTAPTAMDTTTWTTYTSERYGFSIAHPDDWTERPSEGEWTMDLASEWLTTTTEGFTAPDDTILVTAWSVPVEPGTSLDGWISDYCSDDPTACSAVDGLSEPVTMDGHEGVLVRFPTDMQAFALVADRVYVVALWRPASFRREIPDLMDAYLSTVRLLPGGPRPAASESPPAS